MARRRAKLSNKLVKKTDYSNLQASDVLCPICRTILIDPVTLPCDHEFCYLCFNDTMENANLVCPLCRVRVGSWFRTAKRENTLINVPLWKAIKEQYSKEIENKYQGIDNVIEDVKPVIIVSNPGEIRKEYEIQKHRDDEEFLKLKSAEEKASEDLIQKLREEEEYKQAVEEEKLKRDAEFARKLALESEPSTSKGFTQKKPSKQCGPMDKFLKNNELVANKSAHSSTAKEYTCRVLCLDKGPNPSVSESDMYKKSVLPVFQKKILQIQKVLEKEDSKSRSKGSDSGDASDVIEMEYKYYFKPIESQKNVPTQNKTPIRISSLRASLSGDTKIVPPSGKAQLTLKHIKSAFARFSWSSPDLTYTGVTEDVAEKPTGTSLKRKCTSEGNSPHKKKLVSTVYPIKASNITKQIFTIKNNRNKSESPPFFYGFDNSEINKTTADYTHVQDSNKTTINNVNNTRNKKGVSSTITTNILNIKTINNVSDTRNKKAVSSTITTNILNNKTTINNVNNTRNKKGVSSTITTNILNNKTINNVNDTRNKKAVSSTITTNILNNKITINNVNNNRNKKEVSSTITTNILNNKKPDNTANFEKHTKITSTTINGMSNDKRRKMLQEKADYEYAKKLQAELNQTTIPSSVSTRTRRSSKRQVTLDEMLMV